MATYTTDPTIHVSGVIKEHKIGQAIITRGTTSPDSQLSCTARNFLLAGSVWCGSTSLPIGLWQLMQVAVGGIVARSCRRFVNVYVTIATIHFQFASVNFMAERDGWSARSPDFKVTGSVAPKTKIPCVPGTAECEQPQQREETCSSIEEIEIESWLCDDFLASQPNLVNVRQARLIERGKVDS